MEKHREKYNSSSETNYKLSRDHQVMRHGRTLLGRGDPSSAVGFSWPPRSYTCSFCKREFRSAQALGGHMNVHRRDRARLRQCSPPWDQPSPSNPIPNFKHNTNPNPINVPNLNMPPPSLSTTDDKPSSVLYTFPSLISPHAFPLSSNSSSSSLFAVRELRNFMEEGGRKDGRIMREKTEVLKLSLDMEIDFGDLDGSLDLELKLGYT